MPATRRASAAAPLAAAAAAVLLALLWPVTAYGTGPVILPAALAATGALVMSLRHPEVGIAIVLALSPLLTFEVSIDTLGTSEPLKFALPVISLALASYGVVVVRRGEGPLKTGGLALAVCFFIVVAMASVLAGVASDDGVGDVLQLIGGAALMFAALQICRERREKLIVVAGAVAGLLVASIQGLIQQMSGQFSAAGLALEGEAVGRIAGSFGHPNQYAAYVAVFIPLAAALAWTKGVPRWLRLLSLVSVAAAVPALMFAYTRGAVGALVVASLLWLAFKGRRTAVLALALLFVAGFALAPGTFQQRLESVESNEVTLRSDLWGAALDIYAEHSLLGAGVARFDEAYASLPSTVAAASQRHLLHKQQVLVPPHANNLYLTVLAEEGLLGLLTLLAIGGVLLSLATRGSRLRDPPARAAATGLGVATLTLGLHSVLDVALVPLFGPLLTVAAAVAGFLDPKVGART